MSFAEYYLAYKFAIDKSQKTHVILLDRSLSNELASLLYDTSKMKLWRSRCSLIGFEIDNTPIDSNDLTLGRHQIQNQMLNIPSPRGVYLRYAIFNLILRKGPIQKSQILKNLLLEQKKECCTGLKKTIRVNNFIL